MKNATEMLGIIQKLIKEKESVIIPKYLRNPAFSNLCQVCEEHPVRPDFKCDIYELVGVQKIIQTVFHKEFDVPRDRDLPRELFFFIKNYAGILVKDNVIRIGMLKTLNRIIKNKDRLIVPERISCPNCQRSINPSALIRNENCVFCYTHYPNLFSLKGTHS